jgi:hypothetical protein
VVEVRIGLGVQLIKGVVGIGIMIMRMDTINQINQFYL